jgi:hypothetical protein
LKRFTTEFSTQEYISHRIAELRGVRQVPRDLDEITAYTRRRLREIKETHLLERMLDKSFLGCYTLKDESKVEHE